MVGYVDAWHVHCAISTGPSVRFIGLDQLYDDHVGFGGSTLN